MGKWKVHFLVRFPDFIMYTAKCVLFIKVCIILISECPEEVPLYSLQSYMSINAHNHI